jgi:hypothetical protein
MNKIGRLSDATGLWAVFASYDPERKEHSAIICNPPHTKGPSRECCVQDVIREVSSWPGGVGLQPEDDLKGDELEGEDLYSATPLPLLSSVQPHATNCDQTQEASMRSAITQLQPELSKVEQAVELVLEMFAETLPVTELVAAVNIVRNEKEALIFLIIRQAKVKEAWLFNEIRRVSSLPGR